MSYKTHAEDKRTNIGKTGKNLKGYPVKVDLEYQRNEPCACGSGRKFKHCHLRSLEADGLAKQKAKTND